MAVRRYTPQNYYRGAGVNLSQGRYLRALADFSSQLGGIAAEKRLADNVGKASAEGLQAAKGERATGGGQQAQAAFNRAASEREQNVTLAEMSVASNAIYNQNPTNPGGFMDAFSEQAKTTMEAATPDVRPLLEAELVAQQATYLNKIGNNLRSDQVARDAVQASQSFETRLGILEGRALTGDNVSAEAEILFDETRDSQFLDPKTSQAMIDKAEQRLAFSSNIGIIEATAKDDPIKAQQMAMDFKHNPPKGVNLVEAESIGDGMLERVSEIVAMEEAKDRRNAAVMENNELFAFQQDTAAILSGQIPYEQVLTSQKYGDYQSAAEKLSKRGEAMVTGDTRLMSSFQNRVQSFIDAGDTAGAMSESARAYEFVGNGLSLNDANSISDYAYAMTETDARVAGVGTPEFKRWNTWLEDQLNSSAPEVDFMNMALGAKGPSAARQRAEVSETKMRFHARVVRAARDPEDGEAKGMGQIAKEVLAEMDYESDNDLNVIRPQNAAVRGFVKDKVTAGTITEALNFLDLLHDRGEITDAEFLDNEQTLNIMDSVLQRGDRWSKLQNDFQVERNKPKTEVGENLSPGFEGLER